MYEKVFAVKMASKVMADGIQKYAAHTRIHAINTIQMIIKAWNIILCRKLCILMIAS